MKEHQLRALIKKRYLGDNLVHARLTLLVKKINADKSVTLRVEVCDERDVHNPLWVGEEVIREGNTLTLMKMAEVFRVEFK